MRYMFILLVLSTVLYQACNSANTQAEPSSELKIAATTKATLGADGTSNQSKQESEKIFKINKNTAAKSTKSPKIPQPEEAYPFDITLRDGNDKLFNTKDLIGNSKPTVILFWLTTCPPCKLEMQAIKHKYAKWKEELDFDLIAVSVDWERNHDKFREMVAEKDWPWPTFIDVDLDFKKIMPGKLNGLPQNFIFDSKGELVYHKRKYRSGDEDRLFEKLKSCE